MSDCGDDYGGDSGGDSYSGGCDNYSSSSYNEPSGGDSGGYSYSLNDTSSYPEPEPETSRDNDTDVTQSTPDRSEGYSSYVDSHQSDSKRSESEESNVHSSRLDSIRAFLRDPFEGSSDPEPPSTELQPPYEDSKESTTRTSEESNVRSSRLESIRAFLRDPFEGSNDPEPPSRNLEPPPEERPSGEPANDSDRLESRDCIRPLLRDPSYTCAEREWTPKCSDESAECTKECKTENSECPPDPGQTEKTAGLPVDVKSQSTERMNGDIGESIPLSLPTTFTEYLDRDPDFDYYRNHHDYYHEHHHVHQYREPRFSVRRYLNQKKKTFMPNRAQRPTAPTLADMKDEVTFGPDPKTMTCPHCEAEITTHLTVSPTTKTHLLAGLLCLLLLWPCVPCAYTNDCCAAHTHYCPKCRRRLGVY